VSKAIVESLYQGDKNLTNFQVVCRLSTSEGCSLENKFLLSNSIKAIARAQLWIVKQAVGGEE